MGQGQAVPLSSAGLGGARVGACAGLCLLWLASIPSKREGGFNIFPPWGAGRFPSTALPGALRGIEIIRFGAFILHCPGAAPILPLLQSRRKGRRTLASRRKRLDGRPTPCRRVWKEAKLV
eukprot:GHVT01027767.1.p2 GENE.GHVT01027767.1~~GHVT01027767.1.p2  ORF type:complete len:121 (+),score=19.47 GHVT01027767.1:219-581(+)